MHTGSVLVHTGSVIMDDPAFTSAITLVFVVTFFIFANFDIHPHQTIFFVHGILKQNLKAEIF